MNLAVIGSGGREHSICYKLKQSKRIKKLICIPGNAGTESLAKNINIDISDFNSVFETIKNYEIDIVIVGPEQPLVDGIVDFLSEKNVKVFGPDKFASQLEGSKVFMKDLCKKNNIPTAKFGSFDDLNSALDFLNKNKMPIVVKADGLASGKGVTICKSIEEAKIKVIEILNGKYKSSRKVVLEEFLNGEEISYFSIVDGNCYKFFGSAQDHKRIGEGDTGKNTGGMGCYSPSRLLTDNLELKIKTKIIEPTLDAINEHGGVYKGFLYVGLMIKDGEPFLIEFNVRMGDPECQTILPTLNTDLMDILISCCDGTLDQLNISFSNSKSICVVLCSKGYPEKFKNNIEIKDLEQLKPLENQNIFHAGTLKTKTGFISNGGRVLNFVSTSDDFLKCRNETINLIKKLDWKNGYYRGDIGHKVIKI